MSSGPSARNENPRCGSSICGEEMPRSSSTPSIRATIRSSSSTLGRRRRTTRGGSETRDRSSVRARACAAGSRSRATRRPSAPERVENAAAVTAATERGVDVDAAGLDRQRGHGFFEQDRDMGRHRASEREAVELGRQTAGRERDRRAVCSSHCVSSHSSNLLPCPTSTTCLSSAGELAQRRRHQDATRAVEFDVVGVTDEQPLQSARLFVETRQRHQPLLNRLPLRPADTAEGSGSGSAVRTRPRLAAMRNASRAWRGSPSDPCCPAPDA